jgi:hypothetical protein
MKKYIFLSIYMFASLSLLADEIGPRESIRALDDDIGPRESIRSLSTIDYMLYAIAFVAIVFLVLIYIRERRKD